MKSRHSYFAFLLAASLLCVEGYAQSPRWYFGSGLGVQQWQGALNAKVGMGGELAVGRQLSRHSALALVAGFASLPFQQSSLNNGVKFILATREANLFHGDFFVDLHPLGMSTVSPFLRLGGGVLNVQVGSATRKNYMSGVLGGGLRLQLTRDLALNLTGNYHHLAGQALAGFASDKNPRGYVGARMGFTFSARTGDAPNEEPWVTTSDAELSPFENTPAPENNAPVQTVAPVAETVAHDSSEQEEDFWVEEQPAEENETEDEPIRVAEQVEPSVEILPAVEENTFTSKTPLANEHAAESNDSFSNFNRKLDLLDQNSGAPALAENESTLSPLGDEPKFEEFYPQAKPENVKSLREKLFVDTPPEDNAEDENASEPIVSNSAFEERLSKLDEQEDFLLPATEQQFKPVAEPLELPREAEHAGAPANSAMRNQPEAQVTQTAPAQETATSVDLRKLQEPTPQQKLAASTAPTTREELPSSYRATPASPPARGNVAETPKPARTNAAQASKPIRGNAREAAAPMRANTAENSKTARSEEPVDQELLELRAILDKLDDGGASIRDQEISASNRLALNADPEVAELHVRLDEIDNEQRAYQKSSEAYEAFKDRLGLEESAKKKEEPVEWNQQQLKSQINNLDNELAQKEEDLAAVRTALQSAGNAFPTSTLVTRGSFAQGYEGALNSFYLQNYEDAIEKFSRLVGQFPSHTLTSNCYYWLGEAQYGFGDYVTALASFNRILTFQRSLKKDNALLMLGKTYLALQRSTDARAMFNRLLSEYPASDAVAKAQELMKGM